MGVNRRKSHETRPGTILLSGASVPIREDVDGLMDSRLWLAGDMKKPVRITVEVNPSDMEVELAKTAAEGELSVEFVTKGLTAEELEQFRHRNNTGADI